MTRLFWWRPSEAPVARVHAVGNVSAVLGDRLLSAMSLLTRRSRNQVRTPARLMTAESDAQSTAQQMKADAALR